MIEILDSNYNVDLEEIFQTTSDFFSELPWENEQFYSNWLAQTYFMVSHTPRFICLAAARFGTAEDGFHRKMVNHFNDEDKHEYILIKDLKNLGYSIEDFEIFPETSLVVEQLYHQIDRVDPISIFGRIIFLEMLTAKLSSKFKDKFNSQYNNHTGEFLKIHFEEDIEHVQKAFSVLIDLDVKKKKIIGDEFYMTGMLYKSFLEKILSDSF